MDTWRGEGGALTGMTSRPMPSPGIKPIRSDLGAIRGYYHASNAKGKFWGSHQRQDAHSAP